MPELSTFNIIAIVISVGAMLVALEGARRARKYREQAEQARHRAEAARRQAQHRHVD